MPVKIRLTRMGKKKQPSYRVVVVDSRKPRDGAYIEQIGRYDPRQDPSVIEIDNDRALKWLQDGAQPTDRTRKLLEISGAWSRFRVARGDIHTIADTPVEQEAEAQLEAAAEAAAVIPEVGVIHTIDDTPGDEGDDDDALPPEPADTSETTDGAGAEVGDDTATDDADKDGS